MKSMIKSIGQLAENLTSSIKKKDVIEDVTNIFEELNTSILPMYNLHVATDISRNKVNKELMYALKRSKFRKESDFIKTVGKALQIIADHEDDVIEMVEKSIGREFNRASMDYQQANIIYYVNGISFFLDFASKAIQVIIAEELKRDIDVYGPVEKAMYAEVTDDLTQRAFVNLLSILTMKVSQFQGRIKHLDGYLYDPYEHETVQKTAAVKIDPVNMGLIPVSIHPVWLIGRVLNAWAANRQEKRKEELAKLQMMLMALKDLADGDIEKDHKRSLEKQIEYHSNRANKLAMKIEAVEDEVYDV